MAAALARAWVYGGDAARAVAFADEALRLADRLGEPELTADALDAALVTRWGPDDLAERLTLSARLSDAVAHLTDPVPRLSAHLWRLTTAWECLDVVAVQRQLRALDALADETGSARYAFFAVSRRAMHALVTGDLDTADRLIAETRALGEDAAEPDALAVVHSLVADRARQAGDLDTLRVEAAAFEAYGAAEGVPSVSAEAAVLWAAAGEPGRALGLLYQLAGAGLATVTRDVDFLLTITALVEVAAAAGDLDIAAEGVRLLTPYAGRAVLNAGAVAFHGVVDDYLHRAERVLGRPGATQWHSATSAYRRLGAVWWRDRLAAAAGTVPETPVTAVHLHPDGDRGWIVGTGGATTSLPDLKGLHYVRELIRRPGTEISALDLSAAAPGHAGTTVVEAATGELVDRQALEAYRRRLRDIDADLAEAGSWADPGRVDLLRDERDALLAEVRAATGLGHRQRRFSSSHERARVAVRKAVASTIDRIDRHDTAVGRILRDSIHTGGVCRYDPDPGRRVVWLLDPP